MAVEHDGVRLTFGELNRRANRIAHYLRDVSRVRPDDRVAVLARDPVSVVVAMLAAVKAGGAYVPLDPDHPPAHVQQILEDADARCVLFESACAASLAFFAGELFPLDVMADHLDTSEANPEPTSGPADLAYVIYTSGTTGASKGVAVEHRAIVHTLCWRNAYYGFGPGETLLQLARPTFDSSVADIFCGLTSGARLILLSRTQVTNHSYLVDRIHHHQVTYFLITPALYRRFLSGMRAGDFGSLRQVTVAGEWFTMDLVHEHHRRLPHVAMHNEYGPAENAVCSTVHRVRPSDERVLIGRAIDRVLVELLDEDGAPVPVGDVGELYLTGPGLARGYIGQGEPTRARFFVATSGPHAGRRVYRTGDLAREVDGALQFVGRVDRQVKIRGQRVELEHISRCLQQDAGVGDVYVTYRDDAHANQGLFAFVTGVTSADLARLRDRARQLLPAYMVPTVLEAVPEIPITGNGKVDEARLLAAWVAPHAVGSAPASPVEEQLLGLWKRVLPSASFGVEEDFIVAGADSLVVMDLVAGVEDEFGVRLGASDPYKHRTVRGLAALIETARHATLQHGVRE